MDLLQYFSIFLGICGFIFFYAKHLYSYWERKGIPFRKPKLFYGNCEEIGKTKSFSQVFAEFYNAYKNKEKFFGLFMGFKPMLFLTDLDLIKTVLIKDFNSFPNRGTYYNEKDDFLSGKIVA